MAGLETFHFVMSERMARRSPAGEQLHPNFHSLTKHHARARQRGVFGAIETIVVPATADFVTAIHTAEKASEE